MNKFSEKLHHQFVTGKINGAVYSYMEKVAGESLDDSDALIFDSHIKNLSNWDATTEEACADYFRIVSNAPKVLSALLNGSLSNEHEAALCKYAFLKRKEYNFGKDSGYVKLALDYLNDNKDLIKNSHPNNYGMDSTDSPQPQYNVEKWISTMKDIYELAGERSLPLATVTAQVISKWDENEKINFQRWMRYYEEGNYNKYNVKTAQFFSKRQDVSMVQDETQQVPKVNNDVQNIMNSPYTPDPKKVKQDKLDEGRKKLQSRLDSIYTLLNAYRDVLSRDDNAAMRQDLHTLYEKVWNLELRASVVDSIMRTSGQFKKHGFLEGSTELKKIAQEVAENKLPEPAAPPAPTPQAKPTAPVPGAPDKEKVDEEKKNIQIPNITVGDDTIQIPDFNSSTHKDALQKLEEINKVISERNVVRALAAVDIILGQLGIASYFPKLSEAQSKLMDAYNYAGTRVAEVIGMMRGGQGGPQTPGGEAPKEEGNPEDVDVSEDVNKPVGEVTQGGPPKAAPTPQAPTPTPAPKVV